MINAFSAQSEAEMKAKVITRLCNVTQLNQLLNRSLAGKMTASYVNFTADCLVETRQNTYSLRQSVFVAVDHGLSSASATVRFT